MILHALASVATASPRYTTPTSSRWNRRSRICAPDTGDCCRVHGGELHLHAVCAWDPQSAQAGIFECAGYRTFDHPVGDWDNMDLWRNRLGGNVNLEDDRRLKIVRLRIGDPKCISK